MHPEIHAARKGLPGVGYRHGRRFNHIIVHEGYEVNMTSDMPDKDILNLRLEFLDLEGKEQSVANNSSLNFCFPLGYKPTTGAYVSQSTDSTEQMAGTKRSYKDDDAYAPTAKRRAARSGRGGKDDSSATPLSKSVAKESHTGSRKPVIIDLSGDEEKSTVDAMQSARVIMKRLPPDSAGNFPRFKEGSVYIIIDPRSSIYQYRLHRTTLSRISPAFAKVLRKNCLEASEALKTEVTDAHARFDLIYSDKHGKWILRRGPFTVWKQPGARMKTFDTENICKASGSPYRSDIETPPLAVKPAIRIESDKPKVITSTPGILSSGIVADHITIINVAKDGEGNFSEDNENNFHFASNDEEAQVEHHIELVSTESKEKPGECHNSVSVKSPVSVDIPLVTLDKAAETEKDRSTLISVNSDHLSANSAKFEHDKANKRDDGGSNAVISSSGNGETPASASEPVTFNLHKEISLPVPANIGLKGPTVESAKFEDNSIVKAEEDKPSVMKSTSTLDTAQLSAETSAHQVLGQQEITAPPRPIAVIGPPIELCEAYNNLFLIFYSKPPVISTTSISIALKQCEDLISIAKILGSLSVVRPYLGNVIGRFGKQLYVAIAAEPFRWLELSMILESAAIFKESMVHIVGTYVPGPDGQIKLLAGIPQSVRDLIIYKVRCLDQQRMNVNERLFLSSIAIDSKIVTCSFVDTAVFSTWLVVQIWRDWFCQQIAGVHLNPHEAGAFYHTLAKSGDAYLTTAAVKAVIEKIREPVKIEPDELKEDLELLKKFAQRAVKELCESHSMVDAQEAGIDYLTCTQIADEELPWFETEQ